MATRLRSSALLAAGALALHQLRYALAYGPQAGRALREQGHAYLEPVTAAVISLLIVLAAVALHRLASGAQAHGPGRRLRRLWAAATVSLLTVFAAQESVEGLLSAGHPGGAAALLANRGWIAVPLAAAIGLLIALALRGARGVAAAALAVARRLAPAVAPRAPLSFVVPRPPARRRLAALAGTAAGRAPPRACRPAF
jgi:hypothetical protein